MITLKHSSTAHGHTRHPAKGARAVRIGRLLLSSVLAAVLGVFMIGQPAWADGGQSADEGYVMVQQAISHLFHDPGKSGTAEALMTVDEALAAADQDGVDVAMLEEAKAALEAGDTAAGRTLLQDSITEAVTALEPSVGEQTGTTIVLAPLPPRGPLSFVDWFLLALSVIFTAIGIALATILRPRESLGQLRLDIETADAQIVESTQATRTGRN